MLNIYIERNGMMIPNDFPIFLIRWVEITNQVFGTLWQLWARLFRVNYHDLTVTEPWNDG
jgi:hypothetical protein